MRNENIAKVYENWRNTTPIVIPRKLQIKEIMEEPDNQRRLRERRVLDMYRSEKELLEPRAGQHDELLKRAAQEIVDLISKKATGQRKKILINWWKEECIREEEKSVKRWQEKNLKWLESYEEEFRKKIRNEKPISKN